MGNLAGFVKRNAFTDILIMYPDRQNLTATNGLLKILAGSVNHIKKTNNHFIINH